MTEVVLQSSPPHFPSPTSSSSSPSSSPCVVVLPSNDIPHQHSSHTLNPTTATDRGRGGGGGGGGGVQEGEQEEEEEAERKEREREEGDQVSLLELLLAAFRRSIVGCSITAAGAQELCSMEIGVPTNVRHVAHVTFDRFNGFLGLPVEFEPEVPRRPPSASATVFGVSTESMQLSYDSRGNSVPTILLMMQRHLYAQGGLEAEGLFRINGENSQEEYVRDQLNRGVVPVGTDVHCLAGLIKVGVGSLLEFPNLSDDCSGQSSKTIKAWFRELPTGVLDSLSPEQVMQSQSEEECAQLVRLLPSTEAALLDWAINLMADVAQMEHFNKMNARNIAMVFAPNMTHMSDPLTALMYAVQVMNFLKTLVIRTLREREESAVESTPVCRLEPSDENGHQSSSLPSFEGAGEEANKRDEEEKLFVAQDPALDSTPTTRGGSQSFLTSIENIPGGSRSLVDNCPCELVSQVSNLKTEHQDCSLMCKSGGTRTKNCKSKRGQSSNSNLKKGSKKLNEQPIIRAAGSLEKSKGTGTGIASRLNPRSELFEAWR